MRILTKNNRRFFVCGLINFSFSRLHALNKLIRSQILGVYDGEKFEVLEGSEIDMSRKCHSENIERQRQTAIQNGDIGLNGNKYILNVSVPFTSPSSAAMFVLGGSTNGWIEWKNKDGKTLDEMYRK